MEINHPSILHNSQNLDQSLINALPVCVFRTDRHGTITFVNPPLQSKLQLPLSDILGKTVSELFPDYLCRQHHDDDRFVIRSGEMIRKIEENVNPVTGEKSYIEIIKAPIYGNEDPLTGAWTETSGTKRDESDQAKGEQVIGVQGAFWDISAKVRVEQATAERESLLKVIARDSPDQIILLDQSLEVLYANRGIPGEEKHDLQNKPLSEVFKSDWPRIRATLTTTLREGTPGNFETRMSDADNVVHYLETRVLRLPPGMSGSPARLHLTTTDTTQQNHHQQERQQASAVFNFAREAIVFIDRRGNIVNINRAFTDITGYRLGEIAGRSPRFLLSKSISREKFREILTQVSSNRYWQNELKIKTSDGPDIDTVVAVSATSDNSGAIGSFVVLLTDISRQKKHQQHLEHIAHYDPLTHLPNRFLLGKRLNRAMSHAQESGSRLAVLYIDLDGFKAVNDRHGHLIGDKLLVDIAKRMLVNLDQRDTIARLGGDEFMVVVPDIDSRPRKEKYFEKLLKSISQPVHSEVGVIEVSASLGVSYYPQQDALEADQLIRQADVAMFKAKVHGKNRFEIFDTMKERSQRDTRQLHAELEQALVHNQLRLFFQPKVNMKTGTIIGAEVLLRWQHPIRGLLVPKDFLRADLNEQLAIDLDKWVIDHTLEQISRWKITNQDFDISINVSIPMLEQEDFSTRLARQLLQHPEINPSSITLEVLESSAVQDVDQISLVMRATSALGIRFSLDDFGTGYSTLNLLKKLPAKELKIDRTFVKDMLMDEDDLTIIRGVMGLASAFDKTVIAEGVESEQHGLALIKMGCHYAQGYGIAIPMNADDFSAWARQWKAYPSWLKITAPA
ncbi:MAG: EAL domain-containing protein [Ketobacter sp.]